VTVPDDGLEQIHGRVTRRRRTRRAGWLAAAAVLVLVAGIVGGVLRSTDHGSAPYVGDPTSVPTDPPPLLLPTAPNLGVGLATWQLGRDYRMVLADTSRTVRARTSAPGVVEFSVAPGELGDGSLPWQPIEVPGHQAEGYLDTGTPRIRWSVAPGYVAQVAGSTGTSGTLDALVADMQRVIAAVQPTDEDTMVDLLDAAAHNGDGEASDGFRLGRPRGAGTYVRQSFATQFVSTLVAPDLPTDTYQLRSDSTSVGADRLPDGASVQVRGLAGVIDTQRDLSDGDHHVIAWIEDGWQHRLYVTDAVSTDDALAFAESLVVLDDDDWRAAVFPRTVPDDLPDVTWLSLTSDGDSSTATTVVGSGP
jgi:hypothetical protein